MDKGLLPALVVGVEVLGVLMKFALAIVAVIAAAYFTYLGTYYKKHLEKGIGVSVQVKAKRAVVIFGICLVVVVVGMAVCPMLQGMFEAKIV